MFVRHPLTLSISLALGCQALAAEPLELAPTQVSASALGAQRHEMSAPAQVIEGDELLLRRAATLGETLDGLPGVRASSFGAGASRPVIRGLDGARVKVLADGVDVLDASTMSPDHAVGIEPLLAERIEVLKGPAALLYGGGAIGGVVNVIDQRVPTHVPEKGYEGELELRTDSASDLGEGVFGLTAGSGPLAFRVEGVKRQAEPYEIPGSPSHQEGSFNDNESYNLGVSWVGERGYLGMAFGEQNRNYGLLVHEHADCHTHGSHWHCGGHGGHAHDDEEEGTPYIDMHQKRWDLRGELSDPLPGFELARLRIGHSDYQHREMEGGAVATRFENRASEGRLELTHRPLGGWRGVVGVQSLERDFSASGEEAYVPDTLTRNHGLFVLEELRVGDLRYELGLRREWQSVSAAGQRDARHDGSSLSAGLSWSLHPDYTLGLSFSRAQRLPSAEELFARGPHAASRTVEIGNPRLDAETSHNLELSLSGQTGVLDFELSLFRNQVNDFIYAADTGEDIGGGYRLIEYRQEDALLYGLEAEVRAQLAEATRLTLFGDRVRGKLRDGGGDLPRIPAGRLGLRLDQVLHPQLDGYLQVSRTFHQHEVATYETRTAGYTLLGAGLVHHGALGGSDYSVYLKADNLLDARVREHSSFIKDEVLQPGRNLTLGMRLAF